MLRYEKHWFLWYSPPSKFMVKLVEWRLFFFSTTLGSRMKSYIF